MKLAVLKNLKKPTYLFVMLGVSALFFDLNFWMMRNLPGTKDLACVIGANFTTANIIFASILSILTGILVASIVALFAMKRSKLVASSVTGAGFVIGTFTVFCTACTFSVISIFGMSISLIFFTTYDLAFKILSLLLLITGLWLVNRQLADDCPICAD